MDGRSSDRGSGRAVGQRSGRTGPPDRSRRGAQPASDVTAAVVVAVLVGAGACGGAYQVNPGLETTPDDAARFITPEDRLPDAETLDIRLTEAGYVAVFELRAGRDVRLLHPSQRAFRYDGEGRIVEVDHEALLLREGMHVLRRPGRETPRLGRRLTQDATFRGADRTFYPYACRAPLELRDDRAYGAAMLLVWSPRRLDVAALWPPVDAACAQRDLYAQADSIVARIGGPEANGWTADLVVYTPTYSRR